MRARLTAKPVVVLLTVLGLLAVLAATRSTWLTGVADGITGPVRVQALGTDASAGLVGVALVAPAAAIAAITAGRLARWVAVALMTLAGIAVIALSVRVVLDADLVLGQVAARAAGATGSFEAVGRTTSWPWVAVLGGALQLLGALGALLGARSWGALSARYEVPGEGEDAPRGEEDQRTAGSRGEVVDADWDRVSRGEDPTAEGPGPSGHRS